MKRKVVAEVVGEVSNNTMKNKNKNIGSKINPPVDKQKPKTITQFQLLNLGYFLGDECEGKGDNKVYRFSEVLDEDHEQASFCVVRELNEKDWSVLPKPFSNYAPKKKHANSK